MSYGGAWARTSGIEITSRPFIPLCHTSRPLFPALETEVIAAVFHIAVETKGILDRGGKIRYCSESQEHA